MEELVKLIGIKTGEGIYISRFSGGDRWGSYHFSVPYKINGEYPKKTFDSNWYLIDKEPEIITEVLNPLRTNLRYDLKDPSLASDKIPLSLPKDLVWVEDYGWKDEYKHLESLYKPAYDEVPQPEKVIDFEYSQIIETDKLDQVKDFEWDIYRTQWTQDGIRKVVANDLEYQLIDKIRFPKIYYQTHCPVMLQSQILYKIISNHINNNIDSKVAAVTSNYDFCFTVVKKIKLEQPKNIKEQVKKKNGGSYNPPKFVNKVIHYAGDVKVFEMTNEKDRYQNYPVLPSLYADNIEEIENKLNNILDNLMEFINTPVSLCPHCKGSGVLHEVKPVDLNKLINGEIENE
jgi:hypothetical protein